MIPFTEELSRDERGGFCADVLGGRARRAPRERRRELPLRARGARATPRCCAPAGVRGGRWCRWSSRRTSRSPRAASGSWSPTVTWRGAAELLGRPFQIEGGGRGATRAAATSACRRRTSSRRAEVVVPAAGVYAAHRARTARPAAVSIGVRPTFERGGELLIEAYLLGLRGRPLRAARCGSPSSSGCGTSSFDSADELVEQMQRDVERHGGSPPPVSAPRRTQLLAFPP